MRPGKRCFLVTKLAAAYSACDIIWKQHAIAEPQFVTTEKQLKSYACSLTDGADYTKPKMNITKCRTKFWLFTPPLTILA